MASRQNLCQHDNDTARYSRLRYQAWLQSMEANAIKLDLKKLPKPQPPTEAELLLIAKLRTISIAEKSKKIDKKSTLYVFPPEVRDKIFDLILNDYFEEYPQHKALVYQNWLRREEIESVHRSGNAGLTSNDLPAFEIALIPDKKLYCEFFVLRIKQCTIVLRPSCTWHHSYDFSPDYEVADPPKEIMEWVTDETKDDHAYIGWFYAQQKQGHLKHLACHSEKKMKLQDEDQNKPMRGWLYQYPSLSIFSPLMLDSIRSVEVVLTIEHINLWSADDLWSYRMNTGRQYPCRLPSSFDVLSCDLPNAKKLTSLSYRIHTTHCWNNTHTPPSAPQYSPLLHSLHHFLTSQLQSPSLNHNNNHNPLLPFLPPTPQIHTLTVKTLTDKPHPTNRDPTAQLKFNTIHTKAQLLNKVLGIGAKETWTKEIRAPGRGVFRHIPSLEMDCYQVVWEAPVGGSLAVAKDADVEELLG